MGMTITEKILLAHTDLKSIVPDQIINCDVDIALGNDITAPIAINEFNKVNAKKVFDKSKVVLVPDHFAPNKDIASAEAVRKLRIFSNEQNLDYFFEIGEMGIEHALLPEHNLTLPGDLIIGADSHTCTYGALASFATGVGSTDLAAAMVTGKVWLKVPKSIKVVLNGSFKHKWISGKDIILYLIGKIGVDGARYMALEFTGPMIPKLDIDDRFAIANMAIEAGAKNGIFEGDDITRAFISSQDTKPSREYKFYGSDKDAKYHSVIEIDCDDLDLQVAYPHLPSNTKVVGKDKDIKIDQVVIGSCTNGRFKDLKISAEILKGHKVARGVRMIVIPATQRIYKKALKEGLIETFIDAGAIVSTPTCGPCLGGHMGILAAKERAVSTTNRNFVGRMGHVESEVYLANPAVATASAITGKLSSPFDVVSD